MKKIILGIAAIAGMFTMANGQAGAFELGVGPSVAMPLSDWGKAYTVGVGAELQATYGITDNLNIFAQTGYLYMLGKEQTIAGITIKGVNVGLVPIMAGAKYYFSNFHIGAGAGYGLSLFEGETDGAFMYSPQVGYKMGNIDFALHYSALTKDGHTNSMIGLKVFYNFIAAPRY